MQKEASLHDTQTATEILILLKEVATLSQYPTNNSKYTHMCVRGFNENRSQLQYLVQYAK